MPFVLKAFPLAVLGCVAALLVACGDRNGLLSDSQASSLQDALAAVQAACDEGDPSHAQIAADSFSDRVNALSPGEVDRALVRDLRDGASTLESLVARGCTDASSTTTTPTVTTTTVPTTTTATTTTTTPTDTTTIPTTPTETAPQPPPTTTPPDNGGGMPGEGDEGGGGPGNSGGAAPGQVKKALRELEKAARKAGKEARWPRP